MITFDAAGTLIRGDWDPGGIACASSARFGMSLDVCEGRQAYTRVEEKHRAEQFMLEKIGDRAAVRALWQRQMADWLVEMGQDPSMSREVLDEFLRRVLHPSGAFFSLYDDVVPAIEIASDRGYAIGIVSNWDHTLHEVLEILDIYDRFDFIIASLEFGHEKPDRRIFDEAVRLGGASPETTAHVGDSYEADFLGAKNAGLKPLLIARDQPADIHAGRLSSLTQIAEVLG